MEQHEVVGGDTLSKIARRYYGDMMLYRQLAQVNKISNPDLINPGQIIRLPEYLIRQGQGSTGQREDRLDLRTSSVQVATSVLILEARPATSTRFAPFRFRANESITIHYRLTDDSTSLGGGSFAFDLTKGTTHAINLDTFQHAGMTKLVLWAEPFGHAALVGDGETLAKGRIEANMTAPPNGHVYALEVLHSVVRYIVDEMNTNKRNPDVATWASDNATGNLLDKGVAAAQWALRVRTGGEWDHKPKIAPVWGEVNRLGDADETYFYDIYSNIHFAYVGRAAGFSEDFLLLGADGQQRVDHGSGDDPADVTSIKEGFGLYSPSSDISVDKLIQVIQSHKEWEKAARDRASGQP